MYKKILKIASVFGLLFAEPTLAGGFLPPPQPQQPQQIQTVTTTNTATTNQITQINNTNITNTTTITYVNNMPVNIVLDGTLYTTSRKILKTTFFSSKFSLEGQNGEDNSGTGNSQTGGSGGTYGPGGYSPGQSDGYAVGYGESGEVVFIQNEDDQTQDSSAAGVNTVQVVNEETLIQIVEGLLIDAQAQENNIDVYNVENNVQNINNVNSGNNITVVVIGTQNNIGQQIINPPAPPAEEGEEEEAEEEEEQDHNDDSSDSSDSDKECEQNGGKGLKCGLKDAGEDIKDAFHDVKDGIKDAIGSLFHHD